VLKASHLIKKITQKGSMEQDKNGK
jgi:hypothetical protein